MILEPFEIRNKTIAEVWQQPSEIVFDHAGVNGFEIKIEFTDGTSCVIRQEMKEYHIGEHASTDDDRNWFVAYDGFTTIFDE